MCNAQLAVSCHSFSVHRPLASTCDDVWNPLARKGFELVDTLRARGYRSPRSRAAAGIGGSRGPGEDPRNEASASAVGSDPEHGLSPPPIDRVAWDHLLPCPGTD